MLLCFEQTFMIQHLDITLTNFLKLLSLFPPFWPHDSLLVPIIIQAHCTMELLPLLSLAQNSQLLFT